MVNTSDGPVDLDRSGMDEIEEDFKGSDWKSKCAQATKNGYESKSPRREPRAVANASAS